MADTAPAASSSRALPAGTKAPDFELQSAPGQKVSLASFSGNPLIVAFYPADFSPVCGDELTLFNECLEEFTDLGAQIIGISVDGPWCHQAYAASRNIRFPLLSDFEPKGAVSRAYGAYQEEWGVSQRALFVIDADGIIRWSYLSPIDVNPGAAGIIAALEELQREGQSV